MQILHRKSCSATARGEGGGGGTEKGEVEEEEEEVEIHTPESPVVVILDSISEEQGKPYQVSRLSKKTEYAIPLSFSLACHSLSTLSLNSSFSTHPL